ncbi:SDR family oxidoreductase [Panacibacter sp. DH6]|uniref:SDR family oxidoreductase n=1 Tax=Panacibacter microcysteis TaxID=2793269 RepID=A0A931E0W6_9BACT|nr:SDR family oxidoreductase [Panacibacter microcysteis]MBG9375405.1 SDR family oxidoreductase [Panacibacter microcysteis]
MRILITGGAGYIGTELVYALAKNNAIESITVYDNLSRGNFNLFLGKPVNSEKVKFVNGELLDSRNIRKVLKDIDVVYHLAAKVTTPFANLDGHIFEQVNHWGTAELIYALEEFPVKQFVFVSSTAVYGSTTAPATELTEPRPDSFYSISKHRAEQHVQRLYNKMNTHIIRLGNVYGYSKSMRFDAAINRIMFDAHYSGRITINGTGNQHRSFIHIDKVTSVLAQLLEVSIPSGLYNLTDKTLSILDISEALQTIYPDLESFFINQNYAGHDLQVERNSNLLPYIQLTESSLENELRAFKEQFSFNIGGAGDVYVI